MDNRPQELPFVSILMVNYNGKAHVKEYCESVFNLNYPKEKYEVVILDNASSDGSPDWIGQNYPQVKLVRLDKNYGFQIANNIGVRRYCKGDFIAFQNSDVVFASEWLIELVKPALKDPDAIYGSKMLWYSKRDYVVFGGGRVTAWGECFHLNTYNKDSDKELDPSLTMYADGCGFLMARQNYLKLGGFDESYWAYADDYELSWKAWLAGYRIYFVPTAKFYHKVSSSYGFRSNTQVYFIFRNEMRNLIKFLEISSLATMFPLFLMYYIALYVAVYCFQEGKYSLIVPILKAYLSIISEVPSLIKLRRKFQKGRKIRDAQFRKLGLFIGFKQSIIEALVTLSRKRKFMKEVAS